MMVVPEMFGEKLKAKRVTLNACSRISICTSFRILAKVQKEKQPKGFVLAFSIKNPLAKQK